MWGGCGRQLSWILGGGGWTDFLFLYEQGDWEAEHEEEKQEEEVYRPTVHKQTWLRTSYIRPRQHPMSHQATQAVSPNVYKHVPRARTYTSSFYHHFSCPGLEAHSATRAIPQDVRDNKLKQQPNPGPHGLTKAREDPAGKSQPVVPKQACMKHIHTQKWTVNMHVKPNTLPTQPEQPEKQMSNMHESGAMKHRHTMPRPAASTKRPQKATMGE